MNTKSLADSLETLEGWTKINKKSLLFFGGGKKSFPVWQAAEKKGVFENHLLRQEEHDDFHYYILAFCIDGDIEASTLGELKDHAAQFDLGTIRHDSVSYTCLSGLQAHYPKDEDYTVAFMSRPDESVFVLCVADDKRSFPVTAYAFSDEKHQVFPIESKFVQ